MNINVDNYIINSLKWQNELTELRKIVLSCGLIEEYKWRQPCYTFNGKIILAIAEFKNYCVLSFFKGVLLSDTKNILDKPGENSRTFRVKKFTNVEDIIKVESILREYIFEAVEIERSGVKIDRSDEAEPEMPNELKTRFKELPEFEDAFLKLSPGRQRAYLLFFNGAKQSKTKEARIDKYLQRILNGKGMNDCVCGLSHRMPSCDGSHRADNQQDTFVI